MKVLISIGLFCLTIVTFESLGNHDFADLDDLGGIRNNEDLRVSSLGEGLRNAFTQPFLSNWIPVTVLSHQLDWKFFGEEAGGHLLTNLALHACAAVLLFLALSSMTGALGPSAFVGALFAVHPLHVETVAWVSERKGVLSGFFFTLTLLAYASHAKHPGPLRYAGVLAALILALLSKPSTVTLPFVLLLLDFWPLRRLNRQALLEKIPMFAMVAAASVATYLVQRATGAMPYAEVLSFVTRLGNSISAYGTYLVQTAWPFDLAAFYPYPLGGASPVAIAWGAAALLLGTALVVLLRDRRPYLLVGWLWFVGMLVPMIGLVQVGKQSHADRYMYLPLIGLSIAIAWWVEDLARSTSARRVAAGFALGAIVLLAGTSWHQAGYWRDGWAMWRRVLEVDPTAMRAHTALGSMHARLLEFDDAESNYLDALAIAQAKGWEEAGARSVLRYYFLTKASHLGKRGDPEGSLEARRMAVRYDPDDRGALRSLGLALAGRELGAEARPHLERALAAKPGDVPILFALASGATSEGRYHDALEYHRKLERVAPGHVSNLNNLAWLLATASSDTIREPDEAVQLARRLVEGRADPSPNHLDTLAAAYAASGRFDEAVATTTRAAALARQQGHSGLAEVILERNALYLDRRPFIDSTAE